MWIIKLGKLQSTYNSHKTLLLLFMSKIYPLSASYKFFPRKIVEFKGDSMDDVLSIYALPRDCQMSSNISHS